MSSRFLRCIWPIRNLPIPIWQLTNAEAIRWTGPDLNAMAHEIAMEELELIYETIAWRSGT